MILCMFKNHYLLILTGHLICFPLPSPQHLESLLTSVSSPPHIHLTVCSRMWMRGEWTELPHTYTIRCLTLCVHLCCLLLWRINRTSSLFRGRESCKKVEDLWFRRCHRRILAGVYLLRWCVFNMLLLFRHQGCPSVGLPPSGPDRDPCATQSAPKWPTLDAGCA